MPKKRNKGKDKGKSYIETLGANFFLKNEKVNGVAGFLLLILAVVIIIAFVSYFTTGKLDQSLVMDYRPGEWENKGREFANTCGSLGALTAHFLIKQCFGLAAFIIPVFMILSGLRMLKVYNINLWKAFFGMSVVMVWSSVALASFFKDISGDEIFNPGGDHGLFASQWLENVAGTPGLVGILLITALAFLTYLSNETIRVFRKMLNPVRYLNKVKFVVTNSLTKEDPTVATEMTEEAPGPMSQERDFEVECQREEAEAIESENQPPLAVTLDDKGTEMEITIGEEGPKASSNTVNNSEDLNTPINPKEPFTRYKYPTLDLLKSYETDGKPFIDMQEQTENKNRIVEVLNNFGVEINSIKATVGPTITLYEITPAPGIRISKIKNLEEDIALSLAAIGIRIIAPIPGKGTIGIEVPNKKANIVSMKSILNSKKFQETTMELPIALGKTITNEVYIEDLAKIPHLLVAGATGQGKSVGLNAIITSLLYKKHPNELKFVLIDPKQVEFNIYSPISDHFMASVDENIDKPIITDVNKAVYTLKSLCTLMDDRYTLLTKANVRDIKSYNEKLIKRQLRLTDGHQYMPYIVVVIDEYGDLIMQVGKEIELPITRIAQKARAVGIHMIIATQRPTANIITGTIKANFPGRIAFRVISMIDSRTILDRPGANQLIGRGDMLFYKGNEPERVQCAFVDTPEVENICTFIEKQSGPSEPLALPVPAVEESSNGEAASMEAHSFDSLFEEVAHAVVQSQQGSTSWIQRRYSIGFNRAGRLMDQLEAAGIVGAAQGGKPRQVLIQDENTLDDKLKQLKSSAQ